MSLLEAVWVVCSAAGGTSMMKCGFAMALVLVLAVLPAGSAAMTDTSKTQLQMAACGQDEVKFNAKRVEGTPQAPEMKADEALVYLITEVITLDHSPGCIAVVRVGIDGKWVGATCGTSYIATTVKAGEHHLCGSWQEMVRHPTPMARLHGFTAEAGKTYYFGVRATNTNSLATMDMDMLNLDEGKLLVASVPSSTSKPKN
jgi:hypothetical protein